MRYSKDRKAHTRQQIIASACRRFTAHGYAATSIDDVMRDSGLTRGGFYAHFKSKSDLYRHAIEYAATCAVANKKSQHEKATSVAWIDALLDEYFVVDATVEEKASQWNFFATDVGSAEANVRCAYTNAVKTLSDQIRRRAAEHASGDELAVLPMTAMIIGAMAIAQTSDDAALKSKLVATCKSQARALLESAPAPSFFWAV